MKATHAQQKNIVFGYELNSVLLKDTDSTSYLGVELLADMKWNSHVKNVTAKGNTMLGILRRNLKNCPKNLKDLAYKSLLRPKLSTHVPYGTLITLIRLTTSRHLKEFKSVQHALFAISTAIIIMRALHPC